MRSGQHLLELKRSGKPAFIPYITAGDPDLEATELFVEALVDAGASVIELGVPFSDPMADGPVNQRSSERALKNGTSLRGVLTLVEKLRSGGLKLPVVLFTYFNPIHRMGVAEFTKAAHKAGVTGVLALDLPPEEASEYRKLMAGAALETIFLASPTTTPQRAKLIEEASSGFVYYVSRTGVTGVQSEMSQTLKAELAKLRKVIKKPVVVGFGISEPAQAKAVADLADGVVVGSAIVRLIEENPEPRAAAARIRAFSKSIVQAIHNGA